MKRITLALLLLATNAFAQSAPGSAAIWKQRVSFKSGDLTLVGFLFKPEGTGPFPAIVWNHGSEKSPGTTVQFDSVAGVFVPAGYVVFAPMRRGHGFSEGNYIADSTAAVRVVCGNFWGKKGPVDGIAADPRYLDVSVPAGKRKTLPVETTRHAFAYVFEGSGSFRDASAPFGVLTEKSDDLTIREQTGNRSLVLFDRGDEVTVHAGEQGIRFLLVSGKPLEEPVAWYGPIVMNTQAQLQQAITELNNGTFIKHE